MDGRFFFSKEFSRPFSALLLLLDSWVNNSYENVPHCKTFQWQWKFWFGVYVKPRMSLSFSHIQNVYVYHSYKILYTHMYVMLFWLCLNFFERNVGLHEYFSTTKRPFLSLSLPATACSPVCMSKSLFFKHV